MRGPSVPGCAHHPGLQEASVSPQPHHPEEAPVAILPVDMSPVHQRDGQASRASWKQRRCHHQPIPSQGVRAECWEDKGDGRSGAGVSQTTIPSNLHSHEFMSHMKKLDREHAWAFGESDVLLQADGWLL